ncbi:MAG: PHP domain-containing protein [Kiritimatiellae bacterium]|nr:PHP domain-containing protein [Kiritimatiellia bacterium]
MFDLHVHSNCSDGVQTPEEIVAMAASSGLSAVALTDHDTVDGTAGFLKACKAHPGLVGIAGVELSASSDRGTLHILGLGVDASNEDLLDALRRIRESRDERNLRILSKLNALGFSLTWEEVESLAGGDVIGRPHFARAMISRGWAESTSEVFERYLGKGAPAYVGRFRPSPEEAVALVKGAGGVAAVAHPVSWTMEQDVWRQSFGHLATLGLDALECYHPRVGRKAREALLGIAGEIGLLATGGSDYHGIEESNGPSRLGADDAPDSLLTPLLERMSPYGVTERSCPQ